MIITRTPFRISFAGGGTDIRSFYAETPGVVLTSTIDKYMSHHRQSAVRSLASRQLFAHRDRHEARRLEHPIVREALDLLGIEHGARDHLDGGRAGADRASGRRAASPSACSHALHAFRGDMSPRRSSRPRRAGSRSTGCASRSASRIRDIAAYGGLQRIQFNADETVYVDPVVCAPGTIGALHERMMLFYTGLTRSASGTSPGTTGREHKCAAPDRARRRCGAHEASLVAAVRLHEFGELLHESWIDQTTARRRHQPGDRSLVRCRAERGRGGREDSRRRRRRVPAAVRRARRPGVSRECALASRGDSVRLRAARQQSDLCRIAASFVARAAVLWTARRDVSPAFAALRSAHPESVKPSADLEPEPHGPARDPRQIGGVLPHHARGRQSPATGTHPSNVNGGPPTRRNLPPALSARHLRDLVHEQVASLELHRSRDDGVRADRRRPAD